MRIILFRHGERKNDNLTLTGKHNVKKMASQLKEYNITRVFCSPTMRCKQTEKIIRKTLKTPPAEIREELNERWQLNHKPVTKEEIDWWNNYMNLDFNSYVGETCKDFVSRNNIVFNEIKNRFNKDDDILIIAHTATAYALLAYITNKQSGNIDWVKLGNANYLAFEI